MDDVPVWAKDFKPRQTAQTAITAPKEFIPNMTKAELATMALEKLSEAMQAIDATAQPAMTKMICDAVLDRCEGKPGQAVTLDARLQVVTVNANIEFIQPNGDKLLQGVVGNVQVIDSK